LESKHIMYKQDWTYIICLLFIIVVNISIKFNISNGDLYITKRNNIRPQTAQFYNEHIWTDPILVTWQSTVYEPPEGGFKKRPKHAKASVKCF
jgi:hypothetical protein